MSPRRSAVALLVCAFMMGLAARARAGAGYAGMGGVGIGMPASSGDLSENPAAAVARGLDRAEGAVHLGTSFTRLAFAGRAYNADVTTVGAFAAIAGLDFSAVMPAVGAGRFGFGVWQLDGRTLRMDEPLDLGLSRQPGGPPLALEYSGGLTRLRATELLEAAGLVYLVPLAGGDQGLSVGAVYLNLTGRGTVAVSATVAADGSQSDLRRLAERRTLDGFGVQLGWFYRPLPDGSLGISLLWAGPMSGYAWEQEEGVPAVRGAAARPAQLRAGVGGSFKLLDALFVAVDLAYSGEIRHTETRFPGTPAARAVTEQADPTFAIRAGVEYRLDTPRGEFPLRGGFFTRPDPLPALASGGNAGSVAGFRVAGFKQDVTGFTLGTGWERGALALDLAGAWLLVTTHTRVEPKGGGAPRDAGDVRSTLGAWASLTLHFGRPGD